MSCNIFLYEAIGIGQSFDCTHYNSTLFVGNAWVFLGGDGGLFQVPDPSDGDGPRKLLGCMAGTSGAFHDLDSDGYGLQSREGVNELETNEISEVEDKLQEKARFTAELAGRLFQALQAHLMSLPPEARKQTLDRTHAEMLAQKKRLQAERAFLSDQLTQV